VTSSGEGKLTPGEAIEILREMVSGGSAALEGGAEFEVFDEAGQSVFLAPLARHVRLDEDGIIWVRPIIGGYAPEAQGEPAYVFDLTVARRRALDALEIQAEPPELVLRLRSGEQARVRRVSSRTKRGLEQWDIFYYNSLNAGKQLELESLEADA